MSYDITYIVCLRSAHEPSNCPPARGPQAPASCALRPRRRRRATVEPALGQPAVGLTAVGPAPTPLAPPTSHPSCVEEVAERHRRLPREAPAMTAAALNTLGETPRLEAGSPALTDGRARPPSSRSGAMG